MFLKYGDLSKFNAPNYPPGELSQMSFTTRMPAKKVTKILTRSIDIGFLHGGTIYTEYGVLGDHAGPRRPGQPIARPPKMDCAEKLGGGQKAPLVESASLLSPDNRISSKASRERLARLKILGRHTAN